MKRRIIIIALLFLVIIPAAKLYSQISSGRSDRSERVYSELMSVYGGDLTKEEEEKLLKNLSPETRTKLEEIKKLNKNKYNQLLRQSAFYGTLAYIDEHSPGIFDFRKQNEETKKQKELEIDVELLALKYKNSDSGNQSKIKSELSSKLSELFDIKELKKQEEVKQLEKRLQELKESLIARKQNKNEIVARRVQELLGDVKYLKWE